MEKPVWHHFNQVIEPNATSIGTNQYHMPSNKWSKKDKHHLIAIPAKNV